jgi:glycosyltransferase involved in cell wall biosynthesis
MKFSIIIPSYNQDRFIGETFLNIRHLKSRIEGSGIFIEVLLFDNNSNDIVKKILNEFSDIFDFIEIAPDKGQYDAINHGLEKLTGDYWTWLNTDDKLDIDGFVQLANIVRGNNTIDYIYGDIEIIDENSNSKKIVKAVDLSINTLTNINPGIYQPGSFFRTKFTDKIGLLSEYRCCFDYEYVLRVLLNDGVLYRCEFPVAKFRYYKTSKSGSIVAVFIREQIQISKKYGRKFFSGLTMILFLRTLKRKLISE